ncbi:MAG: ParB/RepB/Spo0J family partition protein [Planctomycetota bacterium]
MADAKQRKELRMMLLTDIIPNGGNHRIVDDKSEKFAELVESIRGGGIRVPLLAKTLADGKAVLVWGHRRLLAAARAGLEQVPVIVCQGYTDGEMADMALVENKYREDPTVMEEAVAIADLITKENADIVAARLGRPAYYVRMCANVFENLEKCWRSEAESREPGRDETEHCGYPDWTIAHYAVIARLPAGVQIDLFENRYQIDIDISVRALQKIVDGLTLKLSAALWSLGDDSLEVEGAVACAGCPKRMNARPLLWHENEKKATVKNDRCLDAKCFRDKKIAYLVRLHEELKKEHPNPVLISEDGITNEDFNKFDAEYAGNFEKGTKDGEGCVPALVIHGKDEGKVRWIKLPVSHVVQGLPCTPRGTGGKTGGKTLEEKRALLEKKRWSHVAAKTAQLVGEAPIIKLSEDMLSHSLFAYSKIMSLSLAFGVTGERETDKWEALKTLSEFDPNQLLEGLWLDIRQRISGTLNYAGPVTQIPDEFIEGARSAASLINADIDELLAEAKLEYPEPKSWRNETKRSES